MERRDWASIPASAIIPYSERVLRALKLIASKYCENGPGEGGERQFGRQNALFGGPGCQSGDEAVKAEDFNRPRKIVAQGHEVPLAAHLGEAAHEEVAIAGATFERAEGVLGQTCAPAHHVGGILHSHAVPLKYVLVHPAMDGSRAGLGADAAFAQSAGSAHCNAARVADLEPAAGVLFEPLRRIQRCSGRTTIHVQGSVVTEVLVAETALLRKTSSALDLRHISDDAVLLALLQRRAVKVADVRDRRQRLSHQRLLGRIRHLVKLAGVVAVIDDLARDNQLVLAVHRDLNVVPRHALTALRQKPRVRVRPGQLRLAARLQLVETSLRLLAFGHQRRQLLSGVSAVAVATPAVLSAGHGPRFRGVIRLERAAIGLDILVQRRKLLLQLLARLDASFAGIAVEECSVDRHQFSAQQPGLTRQQHEVPVRSLQRRPIVLAEITDRSIGRCQPLEQPDHFQIALRLLLQPARRANLVQVPVQIQLQKIRRIIRWLASSIAPRTRVAEPQLIEIERLDVGLDRTNWIVSSDVILNPRGQKAGLLPAYAGLEWAIRHARIVHQLPA